jgi:RsiW-degrading membrane proteinase PrsW (M82 family)
LRNNPYFDEHFDGIVYAVCVGMGFAGLENIMYVFQNMDDWMSVSVARAIFSVPGHFFFAVSMGYFYSCVHFHTASTIRIRYIPLSSMTDAERSKAAHSVFVMRSNL